MKNSNVFSNLNASELHNILSLASSRQLEPDIILYTRGERSSRTFCSILSGSMNIVEKDEQIAAVRKGGEAIGEIAVFIPQQRRTFTVITTEPTEILEWEKSYLSFGRNCLPWRGNAFLRDL
ncbi:MAG: cyclic nucleotide-binding domain-containing protein [bacterium]|nr:cyclic nucleotide-binding domain-containing protein [bacterium]